MDGGLRLAHSAAQIQPDSPVLEEALRLFARQAPPRIWLDLDVKTPGHEEGIMRAVAAHGLLERTLVTSFHPQVLREAKRLEPGIATGLAYPNDRHGLSERRPFRAFVGAGASRAPRGASCAHRRHARRAPVRMPPCSITCS